MSYRARERGDYGYERRRLPVRRHSPPLTVRVTRSTTPPPDPRRSRRDDPLDMHGNFSRFYRSKFGSHSPEDYLNLRITQFNRALSRDEIRDVLEREFKSFEPFEIKMITNPEDNGRMAYVNFERPHCAKSIRRNMIPRLQKLLGSRLTLDPTGVLCDQSGKYIPDRFNRLAALGTAADRTRRLSPAPDRGRRLSPPPDRGRRLSPLPDRGRRLSPPPDRGRRLSPLPNRGRRLSPPPQRSDFRDRDYDSTRLPRSPREQRYETRKRRSSSYNNARSSPPADDYEDSVKRQRRGPRTPSPTPPPSAAAADTNVITTIPELKEHIASTWKGNVSLKKSNFIMSFHRVYGKEQMLQDYLRDEVGNALQLRIAQRIPLDDGFYNRLSALTQQDLVLMIGVEVNKPAAKLKEYLQEKNVVGVVQLTAQNSGLLNIIPHSAIAERLLQQFAPRVAGLIRAEPNCFLIALRKSAPKRKAEQQPPLLQQAELKEEPSSSTASASPPRGQNPKAGKEEEERRGDEAAARQHYGAENENNESDGERESGSDTSYEEANVA